MKMKTIVRKIAAAGRVAVLLAALGVIGGVGRGEALITAVPKPINKGCECGLWKISVAAMTAGAALDAASTLGKREMNPLYGLSPDQRFGAKQVAIRALMPVAIGALQRYLLTKPSMQWARKPFTVVNFVAGGAFAGVAARNWRLE